MYALSFAYIRRGRFLIPVLSLLMIPYHVMLYLRPPLGKCSFQNTTEAMRSCYYEMAAAASAGMPALAAVTTSSSTTAEKNKSSSTIISPTISAMVDLQLQSSPVVFTRKQGCSTSNNEATGGDGCHLEFLHIPKTGGTAIEFAASSANISWGACKFYGEAFGKPCGGHASLRRPAGNAKPKLMSIHVNISSSHNMTSCWHLPAHYYHLEADNPYKDTAVFAVVRNPYDRVISEYFYMHELLFRQGNASALNDAAKMNAWIIERLTRMINNSNNNNSSSSNNSADDDAPPPPIIVPSEPHEELNFPSHAAYFQNDGHFIPQYDYIFDGGIDTPRRVVDHVLHFEHLYVEFPQLMQAYNLTNVHLPNLQQESSSSTTTAAIPKSKLKRVGRHNLTRDTLRLMERVYARDFKTFGYQMLSS